MKKEISYTITKKNNATEKEAINYLINSNSNFINPDKESRKIILQILGIDNKYLRAFDLILIPGHTNLEDIIRFNDPSKITLVELKTTKKKIEILPKGFFFGATENEFKLAEKLKSQFLFCFVSLHNESKGFKLISLQELNKIIKSKRIQYQINLKK